MPKFEKIRVKMIFDYNLFELNIKYYLFLESTGIGTAAYLCQKKRL